MKKELRQRFRADLAKITPEERRSKSAAAARRVLECPEYQRAQVVMVFISLAGEIDTSPIALHAWHDHKRVLAPKVSWEQPRMLAIEIHSLTDDLKETRYGLHEPVSGLPCPASDIDLVIVPGLGFDEFGNRLGRGRGFYDRFLSSPSFTGTACAFAYDEQLTHTVPVGPLDHPVDMLVTDRRVLRFDHRKR